MSLSILMDTSAEVSKFPKDVVCYFFVTSIVEMKSPSSDVATTDITVFNDVKTKAG